jgi:beta-lactamase regulating signal transducer with metallopeptidase domain
MAIGVMPPPAGGASWPVLVAGLWAIGAAALLVRMGVGLAAARRLRRSARSIGPGEAVPVGLIRSGVELREHPAVRVPVTLGVFQPCILLPSTWRGWGAARLDAVLRHEVAHVDRGDYLARLLAAVHQAVFWFNPLSWLIAQRLALLAELASDRRAIAGLSGRDYATHLIEMAAGARDAQGRLARLGAAVGASTSLERRIDVLLSSLPQPPPVPLARVAGIVAPFLIAAVVILGSVKASDGDSVRADPVDQASAGSLERHRARHADAHRHP